MTFTAGRACGPRTWRRPTWTRREGTSPAGDGVAVGTVQVGIGTPGLTPIRSFQETEFFTVHSDGASTHPGWCMRLLTSPTDIRLATAPIIATSEPSARSRHRGITHPDPRLARSALEEAVSEASAAALSEALEAASAVAVVGLAAVAVLVEVQASLKGVSTAAGIAKDPSLIRSEALPRDPPARRGGQAGSRPEERPTPAPRIPRPW